MVEVVLQGKLSTLQRKTSESIAYLADRQRKPVQHFVGAGAWDDEAVMAELRRHVAEALAEPEGVLVVDPSGFPCARVLRGIYPDREIVDHWTPTRTVVQRQRALLALGIDVGPTGADGYWGARCLAALKRFQADHGHVGRPGFDPAGEFVGQASCNRQLHGHE